MLLTYSQNMLKFLVNMSNQEELLKKLDILIRLTAYNVTEGKELVEQVKLLDSLGIAPKDIAAVLNKTQNNINVTLHRIKKANE